MANEFSLGNVTMISMAAVVGGLLFKSGVNSFEIEIGLRLFSLLMIISFMIFVIKLSERSNPKEVKE